MITFEGRNKLLKPADKIGRTAHSVYAHVSNTQLHTRLDHKSNLPAFYMSVSNRVTKMRSMLGSSVDYFKSLVLNLKKYKAGNCTEEVKLAELIGKMNGQKNIYVGALALDRGEGEKPKLLEHAVAFITNHKIIDNKIYSFRDNEAVIIDPWLGVTDFAGEYFNKLKTVYRKKFKVLPNNNLTMALIESDSKNLEEFRQKRKEECPRWKINIIPHSYGYLSEDMLEEFRQNFPELVIKGYKIIKLPDLTKVIAKREKYLEKIKSGNI